jgi:DNA-binding NarL/FixJ family response regulator
MAWRPSPAGPRHADAEVRGDPGGMGPRCLIVDDDVTFLTALRHMLERGGVEVVGTASTGDEALERAEDVRPGIVLIDVRLGAESGFDVARRIEERAVTAGGRPVIVLVSTRPEDELADRMAAHPSLRFLDKTTVSADKIRELLSDVL